MIEIKEEFRYRLDKALAEANMRPIDLVRATGISESAISQYRNGMTKPKDKRLVIIANVLDVDPSWLMGLDVPMRKTKTDISGLYNGNDFAQDEILLIEMYRSLNGDGKREAKKRIQELTMLPMWSAKKETSEVYSTEKKEA